MFSLAYTFILQNFNLNSAVAQTATPQFLCTNLSYNMTIGSRDYATEGEVSKLQIFLINAGFLNHSATGYFGVLTRAAVANYQTANNIYPNVGYLGPVTRAAINKDTCSGYIPSNPSSNPSYYCTINGISYLNENDYKNNCVSVTYYFICSINGQTYSTKAEYDAYCKTGSPNISIYRCEYNNVIYYDLASYQANCKPQTSIYYCAINGQTYYNINDYNTYCKSNTGTLPICNINTTYSSTNNCACPSGYTFMNVSNGYKCDNGNYACTMIYVPPYATSPTYDRCHYSNYCPYDGLYYNDGSYCKSSNQNNYTCALNYEYQGGGILATNDCTCPAGSTRVSLGNFGEIYKWKCVTNY